MKRNNPEEILHRAVVQLLDHLGWWYWHTPNGELRDKRVAGKLRAMGVRPGVVDFIIGEPFMVPFLSGNMIAMELKILPNKLIRAQRKFMEAAEARGWLTGVCHSMDEVIGFLKAVRPLNGRDIQACGLPPKP